MLSFLMDGRSVAELLQEKWAHRLQHLGQQRSGGISIQVDTPHKMLLSLFYGNGRRRPPSFTVLRNLLGFLASAAALKEVV
jgi:hypothetical protein